ncbi:uncharacterized protein LOC105835162 [Monomorium pharaonis]|uniref:uncharacterized protein LOC105835162 n=1 Tax=Monomorium pharaonis TaxID=307658 RepID=UPI001746C0B4|nr:uncharacterized protein LOC105835162 [Monomorium pharaonis]
MEQFKTGGDKPEIRPSTGIEKTILAILPSSTEGLPSVWNSDQSSGFLAETYKENANLHREMHTEHFTDTTNTNDTNTNDTINTINTDDTIYINMEMVCML